MNDILFKDEAYKIIGACMEVHKELGHGFLEAVYQEALEREFSSQGILYEREKQLKINYKNTILNKTYFADFVCYNKILIELKAVKELKSDHEAQLFNYLKATGVQLGILINFGESSLKQKRIVCTSGKYQNFN